MMIMDSHKNMRRADRQITHEECVQIIMDNNVGVLSLGGAGGYPCGVPLNYMYYDSALYFHCAKEGRKLELISHDNRACFTIIGKNEVLPDEFANRFQSVMAFGSISIISDDKLKHDILIEFGKHFQYPGDKLEKYVEKRSDACHALKLDIEYMSGKMRR